ncbi:hypothetical protein BYT27DRAFT_6586606 [Phlegmacium glaucopus]|nr:hypothetical protein BYT27DRAFT_6586606 [Phlegmacium glaucopus]
MLSSSSKLFIPLVYISLFIATSSFVQAHELPLHRRAHGSFDKRFLKNRSPSGLLILGSSANADPQAAATSTVSQSTASEPSPLITLSLTSADTTSTAIATTTASSSSNSTTSSPTTSSTATNTSSSTSTSASKTSSTSHFTPLLVTSTINNIAATITSTESVSSAAPSDTAVAQVQSASSKTKTKTLTALIAIAASVGGIAILWTIFRKWKLSSSKEFDRRLNPITDWQPTNGEDDIIPALRRAPSSSSSFHSGGGSGNGHTSPRHGNEHGLAPPEHDFTAGPGHSAPIGGYADLARASSPNPPMQQALGRGPSINHGYE